MDDVNHSDIKPASVPFRRDIQGLRAVAVLLVLAYHAGISMVGGGFIGVDVFFVLSGFLITGLLLRELDETGTIRLFDFYAKRARRLLPASFTVLAFVGAVLFVVPRWLPQLVIPQLYGRSISWDIQRSGLYIVNWLFAERAVDYHSASEVPSPLQHFWSLAVEEQFYAIWPVLLLVVSFVAASFGVRRSRSAVAVVLSVITLASFIYSYRYSIAAPGKAYFVTTTRVWELSSGGLLALALPAIVKRGHKLSAVLARRVAVLLTVGGFLSVLAASVLIGSSTPFPGAAALAPVIGTLAIISGGEFGRTMGLSALLETRWMQWTGERSYSLYLWHWPLLWLTRAVLGNLSVIQSLVVVVFSALPAAASYRWIEQPLRHHRAIARPVRGIAFGAVATVAAYMLGLVLLQTTTDIDRTFRTAESVPQIVEVLGVQLTAEDISPTFIDAQFDMPAGYDSGCFDEFLCSLGTNDADTTILIIGNSHAAHWVPTLEELAHQRDWRLLIMSASGCRTAIGIPAGTVAFERCRTWPETVRDKLPAIVRDEGVDLVMISENRLLNNPSVEAELVISLAYTESWSYFDTLEVPVTVIRPIPGGRLVGIDCPSLLVGSLRDCAMPIEEANVGEGPILEAARAHEFPVLDMNPYLCVDGVCPAVIDDLLVRRDDNHLTNTYALALTDAFGERLDALIRDRGWDEALTAR